MTTLKHDSRRGFQFEIPLKAYQDGLCYACGQTADFHDATHIVYVGLLFSTRGNQID